MGRILSLDVGKVRVGVAVTDELRIIANGLTTVNFKELKKFLSEYMVKEKVDEFVVGLPKQMNGQDSESMKYVKQVVVMLQKSYPDKVIHMVDERFTSVLAHQTMIDGGMKKMQRRDKAMVDQISATIILQTYMDGQQDHC